METEQEKQERLDNFKEAYKKLTEQFSADYANYPMYMPNPNGTFQLTINSQVIDLKDRPTQSPLQEEDIIKKW